MPDNAPAPRKPTSKLASDARASARTSARSSTGAAPTPVKGTTQNIKTAGTKIPPPSAKSPDTSRKSQIAKNEAPAHQSTSQSTTVRKASPAEKTATGGVKPVNATTSVRGKSAAGDTVVGGKKPVSGDPSAKTKVRAVGDSTVSGRATSRSPATPGAQGNRRASETLGGGRASTSGANKDARSSNSGKRQSTRKAGEANPGAAQKSAELAEAAAASRRKSKLIWAVCIAITVVCVGGAVWLLMNAPDSVTGGGKKSSSAGMAFLNEVVRGHRLESPSIEEFSDLTSAIAALNDQQRSILAKGSPHAPDAVTKPQTLEAIANIGLASTLHKEHEGVKTLYDRWVEMQQCFSKKDEASCERAVVLLFQVKTEVTLLTEHLDELRANDDELSRKLHPGILDNIRGKFSTWQQDITSRLGTKVNPEGQEAKLRIKSNPSHPSHRQLMESLAFDDFHGNLPTWDTVERYSAYAKTEGDEEMRRIAAILEEKYAGWSQRVLSDFSDAHSSFQRNVLDTAKLKQTVQISDWKKWLVDQEAWAGQFETWLIAVQHLATEAKVSGDQEVMKVMDKYSTDFGTAKLNLENSKKFQPPS